MYVVSWLVATSMAWSIVLNLVDENYDSKQKKVRARLANPMRTLPRFIACRQLEPSQA